ncbi:hypothetical protein JCM10914A_56030 [Paenibacillus sp. JCM 10914]|uniref:hypothetical protein n=1 Tax=Paenibacillus sp. JCM 10914 TaxID=1236974 RepID=UPI0003CCB5B4|nr:hypothetical protein [Paenibacillus sp. JCM 10914]GAE09599.1 hypothetical protein JCM10914_5967 [Paenibacillus sp. JCM 10914]
MKRLTETERQEIREAHIFYNAQGVPILDDHAEKALDSERVAWTEVDRLRKAMEEALDRICSVQPNAAGFILAEALKEKD